MKNCLRICIRDIQVHGMKFYKLGGLLDNLSDFAVFLFIYLFEKIPKVHDNKLPVSWL